MDGRVGPKLAPFTPSADAVLAHALELLQLTSEDVLYDLGCGDARMLVHAATKLAIRCVGVEYDAEIVERAKRRVQDHDVQDLVDIRHADALAVDLSEATAIFMYLVPEGLKLLRPKLEEARDRGIRIATYVFAIPGWDCVEKRDYKGTKVYLYGK